MYIKNISCIFIDSECESFAALNLGSHVQQVIHTAF